MGKKGERGEEEREGGWRYNGGKDEGKIYRWAPQNSFTLSSGKVIGDIGGGPCAYMQRGLLL